MGKNPKVSIQFSNGNLLKDIANIDGVAGFIGNGNLSNNLNKVFIVNSITDAEQQGITAIDEPIVHRHIQEYYDELGGTGESYWLLVANGINMAQMLDQNDTTKAAKLIETAGSKLGYLGVFKSINNYYNGGTDFIDIDVQNAIAASRLLALKLNNVGLFFRTVIEGRVLLANETSTNVFEPKTMGNGYCGTLIGGSLPDGSASVGALLGRKVKYAAHIKVGKVANGALALNRVFIGSTPLTNGALNFTPVAETPASSTITVTNIGTDGDVVNIESAASDGSNVNAIGSYTKVSGDTTTTLVATAVAAAINTATTTNGGYTANSTGAIVTVNAPAGLGVTGDGIQLIVSSSNSTPMTFTVVNTGFIGGVTAKAAANGQSATCFQDINFGNTYNGTTLVGLAVTLSVFIPGSGTYLLNVPSIYTIQSSDTTPVILATNIANAMAANSTINNAVYISIVNGIGRLLFQTKYGGTTYNNAALCLNVNISAGNSLQLNTSANAFTGGTNPTAAINAVGATTTLTIINKGKNGDIITVFYNPVGGGLPVGLGVYLKVTGDNTEAKVATAVAAAITSSTSTNGGFTASATGAVVTITAPTTMGATMNNAKLAPTIVAAATIAATSGGVLTGGKDAVQSGTKLTDYIYNKGYIGFTTLSGKAGYYFGVDNMCSNDDYKLLVNGAVVDAVAKVVNSIYVDELESEVDTNEDGTISEAAAVYLEEKIKQQVEVTLGERISGFDIEVDRKANIINTATTNINISVLPNGYNTYIKVVIGLTSGN